MVPRTLIVAVLLVAAAEGIARRNLNRPDGLKLDYSAKRLIEGHLSDLSIHKPEVWLLGNSTLAFGVDEQKFGEEAGTSVIKLDHGSATLRGDAAMLDYYLKRAPHKPGALVVFVSMADLSLHGFRAEQSKEYIAVAYGHRFRPQDSLVLYTAKQHIVDGFADSYDVLWRRLLGKQRPKALSNAKPAEPVYKGEPIDNEKDKDFTWNMSLFKDYAFDDGAFQQVAKVAKENGVANVTVVLVPTTDVLAHFQDKMVKDMPYQKGRTAIATACQQNGLRFFDCGDPLATYDKFRDAQHLNAAGAQRFTARVAGMYRSHVTTMVSTAEVPPAH